MKSSLSLDERIVFRVAQLFFDGVKVRDIWQRVNEELRPNTPLTRESVYPKLAQAQRLGFVRLVPPVDELLRDQVAERFELPSHCIQVVYTQGRQFRYLVAHAAAAFAINLVRSLGLHRPVGIGLGPGRATLDFCRHFAELMRTEPGLPKLRLHAIGAGCPTRAPEYASASFFNLFPSSSISERIGFFAEALIPADEFETVKQRPTVAESFAVKDDIDIVINSMGDIEDEHDLLRQLLETAGRTARELKSSGWIGSVQYRPYAAEGPITETRSEMRATTLFELDEFAKMAATKGKHIVLIARQCGLCGRSRARALRPLLESPNLKVWSEIIMDEATANELLA